MEIFHPYLNGLKFLLYSDKNGTLSVSFLKILFLLAYVVSIFMAFFQFLNLTSNDLECELLPYAGEVCRVKTNIFGSLFNLCSLILLFGAFTIILYSSIKNPKKTSYSYLSIFVSGLIFLFLVTLFIDLLRSLEDFNYAFHSIGQGFIIIWVLIFEPILFFSGVPIILGIVSQDYELKGYTHKTKIFLAIEVIMILFVITLSLYWNFILLKNPFVFFPLFNITVNDYGVAIAVSGLIFLLIFIFISILCLFLISRYISKQEPYDHLKAILPWIVLFSLIFFTIRSFPAVFNLGYRLKVLTDFLDVSLIFFVIFMAILQVVSLQENKKTISKSSVLNPLKWTDHMPKYSKILLLLFLNAEIFYQQLYQNAFSILTGRDNQIVSLKAISLVSFFVIGFFSVFFKYKPSKPLSVGYGPIKFIKNEFKKIIHDFNKDV